VDIQTFKLNKIGKPMSFVPCPNCGLYGTLWRSYDPGDVGWIIYCYSCSFKEIAERRIDRTIRERRIQSNLARIEELKRQLGVA